MRRFKDLVRGRIIEPTSKADTIRVLSEIGVQVPSLRTVFRALVRCIERDYCDTLSKACLSHSARAAAGRASLVMYDCTTLYFELEITLMVPGPPLDAEMAQAVNRSLAKGTMGGFGLRTDNCQETYDVLLGQGVEFTQPPSKRPYGVEALTTWFWGVVGTLILLWAMSRLRGNAMWRPAWIGLSAVTRALDRGHDPRHHAARPRDRDRSDADTLRRPVRAGRRGDAHRARGRRQHRVPSRPRQFTIAACHDRAFGSISERGPAHLGALLEGRQRVHAGRQTDRGGEISRVKEVLSEYLEWRQDDEDVVRPWIVSVTLMMFNDRVLLTHREDYPYTWTAGWCYDKGGAAVLAAMAWDVENERSPVGFKKVTGDLRPAPADEGCSCQYDVR